jgi:hypothetical protein
VIGIISEWNSARNSGRVRPADEPAHPGYYVHGGAFKNKAQSIGTRVVYTPWTSRDGCDFAVNVSLASAESEEVDRCLG